MTVRLDVQRHDLVFDHIGVTWHGALAHPEANRTASRLRLGHFIKKSMKGFQLKKYRWRLPLRFPEIHILQLCVQMRFLTIHTGNDIHCLPHIPHKLLYKYWMQIYWDNLWVFSHPNLRSLRINLDIRTCLHLVYLKTYTEKCQQLFILRSESVSSTCQINCFMINR